MGAAITLTASDGHKLDAYVATPDGDPRGNRFLAAIDILFRALPRQAEAPRLPVQLELEDVPLQGRSGGA